MVTASAPGEGVDPGACGGVPPSEDDLAEPLATTAGRELRPSQKARIACQVIAASIWRAEPDRTISSMCKDERLRLGDAAFYDEVTVKRWVQQVAPSHVSAKRGRPKKNNPPEGN
jgi:hypothetical protein